MVMVFVLADQRPDVVTFPWSDKLAHVALYATLGLLSMRATHGGLRVPRPGPTAVAMLITLAYGAFDEWNQTRFPHRDPSVMDWMADAVGAATGAMVARIWGGRRSAASARKTRPTAV